MGKKAIANRPTLEEIEFSKRAGTVFEATRRVINEGGFDMFQRVVDDPRFLADLLKFHRTYVLSALSYTAFFKWLRDNKLEARLMGGSLEKQLKEQEKFYQRFYESDFRINRKGIFINASRLPAIKAGLEAGCLNYALVKAGLSEVEARMTEAEFFFERLMKPLKKDGFRIWAETGTDRWTNLTLAELLQRGISVEPEEFDAEAFKKNWVAEEMRVIAKKRAPLVQPGAVELVFTSNAADIPRGQTIVNKDGEVVEPGDRSYISAIVKKVRVISHAEGIILASQLFAKDKSWLARNTWEWRRDVVAHEDKNADPRCSVAFADSCGDEFNLDSSGADWSFGSDRLRLAL